MRTDRRWANEQQVAQKRSDASPGEDPAGSFLAADQRADARSWPGTFNLLGFTHCWAKSRKEHWVVERSPGPRLLCSPTEGHEDGS
jgi:hypothetical protein